MTRDQRIAASEILSIHDLAMKSDSDNVKAFGILLLARVQEMARTQQCPYLFEESELVSAAEMWEAIPEDGEELLSNESR